jgi:uncharacterized membrane protein
MVSLSKMGGQGISNVFGWAMVVMEQIQRLADSFYRFLNQLGYDHPIHPTLVNLPIGLVTAALVFVILALLAKRPVLWISARHCVLLAILSLFPTALAGIMDWQHFHGGAWLFLFKMKMGLGLGLFVLLIIFMILSRGAERNKKVFLVLLLSFFGVAFLGYFGGEIIFGGRVPGTDKGNQAGEGLFLNRCSGCHPYGANTLIPRDPIIHSGLLKTPEGFLAWIRKPTPPMPPFPPDMITDPQSKELYDYLFEIWGPEEPEKAPAAPPDSTPAPQPSPASPPPASE